MTTPAPATTTPYASASLYVGDLPADITESALFEMFNAVGPVASVRVCRDAATRRSLGYAYVNFHRVEDAERALDTMNFSLIKGKPCRIMWSHRDPALRKSGFGNIFVKNLAKSIDNKALYDTFSLFGNILSCKVATNAKRESLGYGFVHYEADDAALTAIQRVNNMVIAGQKVTVAPFKSKKERGGNDKLKFTNIYVKNIPEDFTKEKFEELFNKHGHVTSSMLAMQEDGQKNKGFGFINFDTPEEAAAAVNALNNHEVAPGKKLFVGRAQKKEEREKELKEKFDQLKAERQKKYAGVNLYVKNLSDSIDDAKLLAEFGAFGQITSAKVMMDDGTNKSRGFGFVCFASPEEATKAVTAMNGKMLDGKPLYVALAQRKDVRRSQLEQQYANKGRNMPVPQPMYPPQGAPIYYAPGTMPQRMMYPQAAMMPRRQQWNPQAAGAAGQPGAPQARPGPQQVMGMPYVGMGGVPRGGAMARGGRGGRGGQQGGPKGPAQAGGRGRGQIQNGNGPQPQNFKYTAHARNQPAPGGMPQPQGAGQVGTAAAGPGGKVLTASELANATEEQAKQMIGEKLFPMIQARQPELAGKITGMLLEMDNYELLHLLDSADALGEKIEEALAVLHENAGAVDGGDKDNAE